MTIETVAKWREQNANAPPPPMTPASFPDDTVSTVYPESSVSNPYSSRYTGQRHRSPIPISRGSYPPPSYRPTSAQGHHRERQYLHPISQPPPPLPPRHRSRSYSADDRYIPASPQPLNPNTYTYAPPKPSVKAPPGPVPPVYYAPSPIVSSSQSRSPSRGSPPRNSSRSPAPAPPPARPYRVLSPVPPRGDARSQTPKDARQYISYGTYHSAPILSPGACPAPQKRPHLLRRLFDWGSSPPRSSSRSSSKTKSRSSDHDSNGRPVPGRKRSHSDNIIYLRY